MKKILWTLVFMTTTAFARTLTIETAIDMALENDKVVKASELSKENSRLGVNRAFKTALPRVVYSASYMKTEDSTRKMIDSQYEHKGGYTQKIGLYQPIFKGGAIIGGVKGAKASETMANVKYMAEKRDLRLDIISIYSDILIYEKNLKVLENSKKELDIRYSKQKKQVAMKLITKADLLKTESSVLSLKSQITGMKTNLDVTKTKLKLKLEIPKREKIELIPFEVPKELNADIRFDQDLKNALTNSLSAKLSASAVEYAKAEKIVAQSSLLPRIDAYVTYGGTDQSHKFKNGFEETEFVGGVSLEWEVFNFGSGFDEYRIARNNEKIEKLNKQVTEDNIRLSLTRNYSELIRLEQLRDSNEKALGAATEILKMDRQRYDAGIISTVDYLASETNYIQAALNFNTAVLNYYVAFETYRSSLI